MKEEFYPATEVTTVVSKRKLKRLRKKETRQQAPTVQNEEDIVMEAAVDPANIQQPKRLVDKLQKYVKTDEIRSRTNPKGKVVVVWNRDVNAGKNIWYLGKFECICLISISIRK